MTGACVVRPSTHHAPPSSLPERFDRTDPRVSPALAPNLAGLPPAIVVTAGFDPLRDQGMSFALALRAAGVEVVDRCEDSLSHSFLAMENLTPAATEAVDRILADLRPHLTP